MPTAHPTHHGIGALLGLTPKHSPEPTLSYFRVHSAHSPRCSCRRSHSCRFGNPASSHGGYYNRAAHWSGQTEAQLHLWTPEIYEAMNCAITVTREVDADRVDYLLDAPARNPSNSRAIASAVHELKRMLHFDFEVDVCLREIGWGWKSFFRSATVPPEIRARNDSGKPLPPDRAGFCVACCVEKINWPRWETRNLQNEAEEQVCAIIYLP
jgi:hypothetical protein